MMRTTLELLVAASLLAAAVPALADMDVQLKPDLTYAKGLKFDQPTAGKNFGQRVAAYVRIQPPAGKIRAFPAFISTHNYLQCPDSDKRNPVVDIKQVSYDRRSGIKVLGFFFDPPDCEKPTFHWEPILAD